MRVGVPDPRRGSGEAITTGRMSPADAIALLRGPRQEEIQELLDEFFTAWGYTLAHHPRVMQFGAFALWLEGRGLARLPGGPEKKSGVAGGENEEEEEHG